MADGLPDSAPGAALWALLERLPPQDASRMLRLPVLEGATSVEPLAGGITNRNYKAVTPHGSVVVRISDVESSLLAIDRDAEHRNSLAAAFSGAGAPVVDYLPGEGVLVVGFIEGRTFTEADLRDPANLPRVAAACRRLHGGPRFVRPFDMFDVQRGYLDLVLERGFRLPPGYLDHMPTVERIRAAMSLRPEPTVPCNNDLLAGNFVDDGHRLWLIDYEYSGNNEASFELGNIWSESVLPLELLEPLVSAYWGERLRHKVARARLWGLISKYGWMLWASIQDAISPLDFDYWSWGTEKYERAVAELRGPDLETLLEEVAAAD